MSSEVVDLQIPMPMAGEESTGCKPDFIWQRPSAFLPFTGLLVQLIDLGSPLWRFSGLWTPLAHSSSCPAQHSCSSLLTGLAELTNGIKFKSLHHSELAWD